MGTKSATQLIEEERVNKEKKAKQNLSNKIKETIFFETKEKGPVVKLRFTGDGLSPAFNKEFRGVDGKLPVGNIVVPRSGLLIVSKSYAEKLEENYPEEFQVLKAK